MLSVPAALEEVDGEDFRHPVPGVARVCGMHAGRESESEREWVWEY